MKRGHTEPKEGRNVKRIACACLLLMSLPVLAETVTDVRLSSGGTYVMKIDGKDYVAITKAQLNEMVQALQENATLKSRLTKADQDLKDYRSLTNSYEQLKQDYLGLTDRYKGLAADSVALGERYSDAAGKLVTLTNDYRGLTKDYDALSQKYRDVALRTAPRQPIDLGLGVIHSDDTDRFVAMAGIGTQVFGVGLRGWVFGGHSTYGVMIGTSF